MKIFIWSLFVVGGILSAIGVCYGNFTCFLSGMAMGALFVIIVAISIYIDSKENGCGTGWPL